MENIRKLDVEAVAGILQLMSQHADPDAMYHAYSERVAVLVPTDRTVSLSRRNLTAPAYRVTRNGVHDTINPWKEPQKLPLLNAGLLGDLLYGGEAKIINALKVAANDPGAELMHGMGSLAAIPHYDDGEATNMVVMMRKEENGFDRETFPELVLLSGLFGRAMKGLVLADDLRREQTKLHDQYMAVSELSDTVLEQARMLKDHAAELEEKVRKRTRQLEVARLDAIHMLATASEEKDVSTGDHIKRIQYMATGLARALNLAEPEMIGLAAILHDVGKMHVPDSILRKPGPLTDDERAVMKEHTLAGERILSSRAFFAPARRVARSHHENWDGSGYPDGLKGEQIPIEARLVHLVDVYDALVNDRPYKLAWTKEQAIQHIKEQTGVMFDPALTEAFLKIDPGHLLEQEEKKARENGST